MLAKRVKMLIITSTIDCTVDYIMKKYNNLVDMYRLNVDEFPKYEICIGGKEEWIIKTSNWKLKKSDVYSIYYRKPNLPKLDEFEECYRNMIAKDIISLINGIVDEFEGKVLTKPYILRKTENKILQLLYAQKHEFLMPRSFIGNSNQEAKKFLKEKSIIKPITTGKIIQSNHIELYQTNYFTEFEDDISMTPIYLQNYIEKEYEVRMTYINGHYFTVRLDSEEKLDWRSDYGKIKYSVIECPVETLNKCTFMLQDFDLFYGAFDFIVDKNGNWIFLEVNPNGQWQWLEQILKLPISERIVSYLLE